MIGELPLVNLTHRPCCICRLPLSSVSPLRTSASSFVTLARAGNGTGEGRLLSIVFGGTEVMNTLW